MMRSKILVLIDLSGTLHIGDVPTPKSVEALQILRQNSDKFSIKFVTNTTKESKVSLHSKLFRCGFNDIKLFELFSSLSAAYRLILKQNLRPLLFLEPDAMNDFRDIPTNDPNSVVIGLAPSKFDFDNLNEAFKILLHSESAELIAINKSRYFKSETGNLLLGPGPFVECLQFATGKTAKVVGKPESEFFHQAIQSVYDYTGEQFRPQDVVMIGDDVRDDVIGAIKVGLNAILVRTGKYRKGDENEIAADKRNCVDTFYDAVQNLLVMYS